MGEAPCGCARLVALRKQRLPAPPEVARLQAEWRCPAFTGRPPPADAADLSPGCRQALDEVRQLTGVDGLTTCPRWYASRDWVARAVRAHHYREKGSLAAVEALPLHGALRDALDEIDRGQGERFALEQQRARREQDDDG